MRAEADLDPDPDPDLDPDPDRMEPRQLDVQANGLRHRVLEWDGGGAATVLCLHGFLDSAWAFFEVAPRLAAAGLHVVAPDLRGHGETDRVGPGGQYHFMDYVLDVAELAGALARERLLLVGHSMGASICCYLAGAFPARAGKVALLEGPLHFQEPPEPPPARLAAWIEAVRRARERGPRILPSVEAAAERLRALDPRCPPETARALAARATHPVEGGVAFRHDPLHLVPSPYPFQVARALPFWRALACPVLLLDGEDGELPRPPDFAERLAAFGAARRVLVPGAGHMLMRHQPARVAEELLRFLP